MDLSEKVAVSSSLVNLVGAIGLDVIRDRFITDHPSLFLISPRKTIIPSITAQHMSIATRTIVTPTHRLTGPRTIGTTFWRCIRDPRPSSGSFQRRADRTAMVDLVGHSSHRLGTFGMPKIQRPPSANLCRLLVVAIEIPNLECYHFVQWMPGQMGLDWDASYVNHECTRRFLEAMKPSPLRLLSLGPDATKRQFRFHPEWS